jgi:hypothetical protein
MKTKLLAIALAILLSMNLALADKVSIPTDENTFAQEIYYGLLYFFSHIFIPFLTIIAVIVVAFLIFVFLSFIRRLVDKI